MENTIKEQIRAILEREGYSDFQIGEMLSDGTFGNIREETEDFEQKVIDIAIDWYNVQDLLYGNY